MALTIQEASWSHAAEPPGAESPQAVQLARQIMIRPLSVLKGAAIGTATGAALGVYAAHMISLAALPDRCVAHARFISTVKGGPLCYAAWAPLFTVTAPLGLVTGVGVGAPVGAWYGLKNDAL
jgi:hypothetical protein